MCFSGNMIVHHHLFHTVQGTYVEKIEGSKLWERIRRSMSGLIGVCLISAFTITQHRVKMHTRWYSNISDNRKNAVSESKNKRWRNSYKIEFILFWWCFEIYAFITYSHFFMNILNNSLLGYSMSAFIILLHSWYY